MTYPPDPYQPPDPYRPADPYQAAQPPPPDPTLPYPPPYTPTSSAPSSGPGYPPPPPPYGAGYGPPPSGPGYPPPGYPPPDKSPFGAPGYGAPYSPPYGPQNTNALAIASLVCSIAGVLTCVSAPVGIVLGHIAKKQIRQTGEAGDGLATAGLWVGYILTVISLVVAIFYAAVFIWAFAEGAGGSTTF
jgi:hypothetical protein